ncbi:hypothetical protein DM860_008262 [Cuscuta australis]|uniref:Uncharacterized protein n=1 Tax=Cuscuta australis TaxID=267555 RepID=A0A328D2T0_9ASTE|nr:hypothetical protein DM860_008262 [Cuscuta australis]
MAGQSGMTQLLQPQQLKCPVVHYEAFCEISKRNEFQGWSFEFVSETRTSKLLLRQWIVVIVTNEAVMILGSTAHLGHYEDAVHIMAGQFGMTLLLQPWNFTLILLLKEQSSVETMDCYCCDSNEAVMN